MLCVWFELNWAGAGLLAHQVSDVKRIYKLPMNPSKKQESTHSPCFYFYYIFRNGFLHSKSINFFFARTHRITTAPVAAAAAATVHVLVLSSPSACYAKMIFLSSSRRAHLKREFRIFFRFPFLFLFEFLRKAFHVVFLCNISSGQFCRSFFCSTHKLIFIVIGIFMAYFVRFIKTIVDDNVAAVIGTLIRGGRRQERRWWY